VVRIQPRQIVQKTLSQKILNCKRGWQSGASDSVNGAGSVCDQDFQILVPHGRIHGRTRGYKWSLLKVREGKYKEEYDKARCSSGAFKIYDNLREGENK
jgi:hypothetical protein